jgi:hypothetical protein
MHSHFPQLGIFYVINEDLYMESIQTIEGEDWGGNSKRIQTGTCNIGWY